MSLTLNEMVLWVIFGSMGLIAFVSVSSRFLHHRVEARLLRQKIVCRLCGRVFQEPIAGKTSECRHCGKLNLQGRNGKLG